MSTAAEEATKYYERALVTSDYYVSERGLWGGKGAERLALQGEVSREDFLALAKNQVPGANGKKLTARTKTTRREMGDEGDGDVEREVANRRAGYDFTFSVPKSVSLYLAETGDKVVERAVRESFTETMADIGARMETRVRIGGQDRDRVTGNIVYASFVHKTSRPIDGVSDPHYHIHGYVFNATFDGEEERWKAGQFGNIKADGPFYEAAFNARLADKLLDAGYGIRRTDRDFEFASVTRELIEKFSKRTREIEQLAKEQYTVLYAQARALVAKTGMEFADAFASVKGELGAKTRKKKSDVTLSAEEQLANWRAQMTPAERTSLRIETVKGTSTQNLLDPETAKALAVDHLFERASVVRVLLAAGMLLRRGLGRVTVDQARAFVQHDSRFIRPDFGGKLVTTREVLAEEEAMVRIAEAGKGAYPELGNGGQWQHASPLVANSEEQKRAIEHLLRSRDLVTSIRGPAGSGKTAMMQEAVKAIAALSGKNVIVAAPSSSAVGILKKDDFSKSDTVQRFMLDDLLQEAARGQVLWVDEAGFLSARDMRWVVEFASKNDCRLILSGDTRQHHGVERGDALRVMETNGVVIQAALTKMFRQQIPALKAAIQDLSQGKSAEGFDKLDKFGAIREIEDNAERLSAIVRAHLAAVDLKRTSLVVAPTHAECRAIADAVRAELKKIGLLPGAGCVVTRLQNTGLTESQRRDPMNYEPGQVVEFHRLTKGGFKSGQQWEVLRPEEGQVVAAELARKSFYLFQARPSLTFTSGRRSKSHQAIGFESVRIFRARAEGSATTSC
jgi:conjugative relaxase-like TrwC/TraI family protein